MRFKWEGDKATAKLMARLGDNMDDAGAELAALVRDKISTEGPPRSLPGQPPHIDTSALIESYGHETDKAALETRVGSSVDHSVYLESGTPRMAPRPHLVSTLLENLTSLARIIFRS